MPFPFTATSDMQQTQIQGIQNYEIQINSGLTTFVGPNGSGKTLLLRGLKTTIGRIIQGKKVRFLSAGRIGQFENYRSDYDGRRPTPNYELATFGAKHDHVLRHKMETITGDFQTLAARPDILIKVQERLRKLFRRDLIIEWDSGNLTAKFTRTDQEGSPYSSAREASGIIHLVAILSALYDNEVGALLLDEPEVSLHPQLQAFLLREILRVAGDPTVEGKKLILIATHSTGMIELRSPLDLPSFVFCYDIKSKPVQILPDAGELQNQKIKALIARIGQEHKLALFCKRPLLVEGPTDSIICSGIDRKLDLFLEAAGSQILPVIGKGQMPIVVKMMRLIGKEPAVLADADALTDGLDIVYTFTNTEKANALACEQGSPDANSFAKSVYSDFCQMVTDDWASIQEYSEQHPYWINRDEETELDKVKRRATFATLMDMSEERLSSINNTKRWQTIKVRLNALLDMLEKVGCFILRRGAIESYYNFADTLTSEGKPSAAVDETEGFMEEDSDFVKNKYKDIVRCLEFVSRREAINEAEAIREIVLAIAAPALAELNGEISDDKLQLLSRRLFGEKAKLFRLEANFAKDRVCGLSIYLESPILEVEGFPIKIQIGENPVIAVNKSLKLQ